MNCRIWEPALTIVTLRSSEISNIKAMSVLENKYIILLAAQSLIIHPFEHLNDGNLTYSEYLKVDIPYNTYEDTKDILSMNSNSNIIIFFLSHGGQLSYIYSPLSPLNFSSPPTPLPTLQKSDILPLTEIPKISNYIFLPEGENGVQVFLITEELSRREIFLDEKAWGGENPESPVNITKILCFENELRNELWILDSNKNILYHNWVALTTNPNFIEMIPKPNVQLTQENIQNIFITPISNLRNQEIIVLYSDILENSKILRLAIYSGNMYSENYVHTGNFIERGSLFDIKFGNEYGVSIENNLFDLYQISTLVYSEQFRFSIVAKDIQNIYFLSHINVSQPQYLIILYLDKITINKVVESQAIFQCMDMGEDELSYNFSIRGYSPQCEEKVSSGNLDNNRACYLDRHFILNIVQDDTHSDQDDNQKLNLLILIIGLCLLAILGLTGGVILACKRLGRANDQIRKYSKLNAEVEIGASETIRENTEGVVGTVVGTQVPFNTDIGQSTSIRDTKHKPLTIIK